MLELFPSGQACYAHINVNTDCHPSALHISGEHTELLMLARMGRIPNKNNAPSTTNSRVCFK